MLLAACLVLTLAVLAGLSLPLRRQGAAALDRSAFDLKVYRAQLDDLQRDLDRGTIEPDEAALLRVEIERRILRAAAPADAAPVQMAKGHRLVQMVIMLVLVILPLGLYTMLGSPRVPDQPYADRAGEIAQMQGQAEKIQAMVDQLAAKLQDNPNDGPSWVMLGRSLRVLHQTDRAQAALRKAVKLMPTDVQTRLEYGATLIADVAPGSPLPDEFVIVMRDVLAMAPDTPEALYFVGLAEAEQGHNDKARDLWSMLIKKFPADSPDRAELQKQMDGLKD